MITDTAAKQSIVQEWHTLRKTQAKIRTCLNAAMFGPSKVILIGDFPDLVYCLLLPFGYSVLESTLKQLRKEQVFRSNSTNLKPMMDESRQALPWQDFVLVNEGREKRNEFSHDQSLSPRQEVLRYLDAVEGELIAWRILPGPVEYEHTIGVSRTS